MPKTTFFNLENHDSVIKVSGEDAATFLQGQVTCDINTLDNTNSLIGAFCNPKGRVISLFYIAKRLDAFYLVVPSDICETLVKRLKMFVFRSNVQVQDTSIELSLYGYLATPDMLNSHEEGFCIQGLSNTAYLVTDDIQQTTLSSNANNHINTDLTQWNQVQIEQAIPRVTKATSELFIPQTLNLDVIDGISFTKGCYTGQEIIARLHYKGSVKRRLFIFESSTMIPPATDLHSLKDKNSVGTTLNCQLNSDNSYKGTFVIKLSSSSETHINCDGFGSISINAPPYSLSVT